MKPLPPYKNLPYAVTRQASQSKDPLVQSLLDYMLEFHKTADQYRSLYIDQKNDYERLYHENEFMIKWINSKITQEIKDE